MGGGTALRGSALRAAGWIEIEWTPLTRHVRSNLRAERAGPGTQPDRKVPPARSKVGADVTNWLAGGV